MRELAVDSRQDTCRVITACRSCGGRSLAEILSLGELHVSNFVDDPAAFASLPYPLDLVLCDVSSGGCGLLQLRHTVPPKLMYRNYWYRSGMNRTMSQHLAGISSAAWALRPLKAGDIVLDIGANDGTLLRSYQTSGLVRVGFEPAENLVAHAAAGTDRIFNDFFSHAPFAAAFPGRRAKVITAIAMFYDLDDPNAFVRDVARTLDADGVAVIEMHYLPAMLAQNSFDAICHEHLEYYALTPLERLLERHGLEVFDVEENVINGGSFRAYIRHAGSATGAGLAGSDERLRAMRAQESKLGLGTPVPYEAFAARVRAVRDRLSAFVRAETAAGKRVYVYGASTKGNTILQFCGLDRTLIAAAAERNPDKWGKHTVATNIPIVSETEARAARPDYFLVLPWHFLPEFREREAAFLAGGGKFLVPLPEPRLIGADGEQYLA